MKNKANAVWIGTLKEGKGSFQLNSVDFNGEYSFGSRFENKKGTNPEELIGAAHASCFSMALSQLIGQAGYQPEKIDTNAHVTLSKQNDGFSITEIELTTTANIPEIKEEEFIELAEKAKINCPVSKALASVNINMQAKLI